MGMFDTIIVVDKLPITTEMEQLNIATSLLNFQSKDLDCLLNVYVIQGGKLFVRKTVEEVESDGAISSSIEYLEDVKYHGFINFYDSVETGDYDCWVEYSAIFTHGICTDISLTKFEKTGNSERKKGEKEFWEGVRKNNNKWSNKYFFHTRFYQNFRKIILWVLTKVEKVCFFIRVRI
jgi:hypothetical protein